MSDLLRLTRPAMRDIVLQLIEALTARASAGPAEPALDGFIPQLTAVATRLSTHVDGSDLADATRRAQLARLDVADDAVDTWLRHIEGYVHVESLRRHGARVGEVTALRDAAFPEGLEPVKAHVPDENRYCRAAIAVLGAPEHALLLEDIGLPAEWLVRWGQAVDESEAAHQEVESARLARTQHVSHGSDAQADFVELVRRLRRYVESRASRRDKERFAEGQRLLAPLTVPLKKLRTETLARATRRQNAASEPPGKPADGKPADGPSAGSARAR